MTDKTSVLLLCQNVKEELFPQFFFNKGLFPYHIPDNLNIIYLQSQKNSLAKMYHNIVTTVRTVAEPKSEALQRLHL